MFRLICNVFLLSTVLSFKISELKKLLVEELINDELDSSTDERVQLYISNCSGERDGIYGDRQRCDGFIQCVAGKTYRQACPGGLAYNPRKGQCEGPVCNTGSSNPTFCGSRHDGDYKYPSNCRFYVTCANGLAYFRNCNNDNGGTLEWNDEIKRCDYPQSAKCKPVQSAPLHCIMKNRIYSIGEKWKINCELSCSCTEGAAIDCRQICPMQTRPCGQLGAKSFHEVASEIEPSCMCERVKECNAI